MNKVFGWNGFILPTLLAVTMAAGPVLADKPEGEGEGQG
jgi:hypothetical protein